MNRKENISLLLNAGSAGIADAVIKASLFDDDVTLSIKKNADSSGIVLVCFRLSLVLAVIERVVTRSGVTQIKRLQNIEAELLATGMCCSPPMALFPDDSNPRFLFPMTDKASHHFLFSKILFPRRYALGLAARTILGLYTSIVSMRRLNDIWVRNVGIIVSSKA